MSEFQLFPVPGSHLDAVWPRVRPYLELSANKSGDLTTEEYLQGVHDGRFILFTGHIEGKLCMASVLCVEDHAAGRVLNVLAWGGESPIRAWAEASIEAVVPYARDLGATRILAIGHNGLKKIVPSLRPIKTLYERRI